jgi:hypothetical protein
MNDIRDDFDALDREEWRLALEPRVHPHAFEAAELDPGPNPTSPAEWRCDVCDGPAFIPPYFAAHQLDGRLHCDRCWQALKESDAA